MFVATSRVCDLAAPLLTCALFSFGKCVASLLTFAVVVVLCDAVGLWLNSSAIDITIGVFMELARESIGGFAIVFMELAHETLELVKSVFTELARESLGRLVLVCEFSHAPLALSGGRSVP